MKDNNSDNQGVEVVFMPGCFDSFEGTQEELDELVKQIKDMANSGQIFENSELVYDEEFDDMLLDDEVNMSDLFQQMKNRLQ